ILPFIPFPDPSFHSLPISFLSFLSQILPFIPFPDPSFHSFTKSFLSSVSQSSGKSEPPSLPGVGIQEFICAFSALIRTGTTKLLM
ncbi:hypothetical protein AVEN_246207-1, partial [Araneus ventricosus]